MSQEIKLPDPMWRGNGPRPYEDAFSRRQMIDYAAAAVLADRKARGRLTDVRVGEIAAKHWLSQNRVIEFVRDIEAAHHITKDRHVDRRTNSCTCAAPNCLSMPIPILQYWSLRATG